MSETKSVRRRNLDIIRQHSGTTLGSLIYSVERFCQHLWAKFRQNRHVCQICHFRQIRQHFGTLLYRQINIFSLMILSTRHFSVPKFVVIAKLAICLGPVIIIHPYFDYNKLLTIVRVGKKKKMNRVKV